MPSLQRDLSASATAVLSAPEHTGAFADVAVRFSGQEAYLTGQTASAADKKAAADLVANSVRATSGFGRGLNPVTAVHNEIVVDESLAQSRPKSWLVAARYPEGAVIGGVLKDDAQVKALTEKLAATNAGADWKVADLRTAAAARPMLDWEGTLKNVPQIPAPPAGATRSSADAVPMAVSAGDGTWQVFPKGVTDQGLMEAMPALGLTFAEISRALKTVRTWEFSAPPIPSVPSPAPLAKSEAKTPPTPAPTAVTPPVALPPAPKPPEPAPPVPAKQMEPQAAAPPGAVRHGSAFLGWAVSSSGVNVFGRVPDAAAKDAWLKAAAAAFPNMDLQTPNLRIDPTIEAIPASVPMAFPADAAAMAAGPAAKQGLVGVMVPGGDHKSYKADVFDSEIARDFAAVEFRDNELSEALGGFRKQLVESGGLQRDDPYISLLSDGKTLQVRGELASERTRNQVIEALKAQYGDKVRITDEVSVTPLVTEAADMKATLDSLAKFDATKPGSAAAKAGQAVRSGLVHAIYFQTGSDRSKDQERALYQMRRLLALNPGVKFQVVGHTDNVGAADQNQKLSGERADKLVAYLAAAGIPQDKLSSRGAGQKEPIADNATESGRAQNRRVDVLLQP
ncbi:MAG: OmpA family protein [Verrucomicrobiales bacterium]|nr:OmpA family protein [Verrucomicrobiales bacterium]MCP5559904.1 OmpA family protein [Verrucomicrobiaceae bacterium]